ncbi:helix-turn-helix domain-containing protein [Pseudomonas proteolytica]|uniref:Helix-turn-helix domain-containing protein n=1 Tax=Pseudomonas proteolytica TaxID=219574 RepID=A0AAW5AC81_9PSED|nr:helix-turn-helix domain-containing protein [Pseudomonas proteolytica]KAA8701576.1 helix-turn-helix transcriptional regulator [Pseudomonas proteolytica]MCF5059427.1 helix-turn-helix domain-containing protein [Pseudomonas proteolytica]MCF5104374.1 helix-turn-helix domain-containing protein [Pseudomonas proteolytica]TWR81725.1 helix-turn-helix transcriptional regulator [Pseudomonas proteolytica]SEE26711.1 Helix-turn-helix domain-containing protein [Pseudomonas proteolytica]
MSRPPFPRATPDTNAGTQLRQLRREAKLSQLELALISGISQRHLSCIETGRAKASPGTLHNLLGALDVPLERCNNLFLAAGYAPRYEATPLAAPAMDAIREAINHVLKANNPAPAIVLGSHWEVLAANASTQVLFDLVGLAPDAAQGLNLLTTLLQPGGLGDHLLNADEIRNLAWQRAAREALGNPALATLLESLPVPQGSTTLTHELPPLVLTRINSRQGQLDFMSTFTTFGMPQDITVTSLRIEHLIPANPHTWHVMTAAYEHSLTL